MRSLSAAVLLAVCSFALGGALTFAWLQQTMGQSALQKKLDEANIELTKAKATVSTLLTEKQALELTLRSQEDCGEFLAPPADGWVPFIDETRGLAIQLPFNELWGYEGEPIAEAFLPLVDIEGIQFGPPFEIAPCAFAHSIQLTFIPARGSGAIKADVLERNAGWLEIADYSDPDDLGPFKTFVGDNDWEAYEYSAPSDCTQKHIEVLGREYNYIFSACPEGESALPDVLDSVELL